MKRFCCDKFQFSYSLEKNLGLNFRIIKINSTPLSSSPFKGEEFRYLVTEGYQNADFYTKIWVISYCPFCGCKLSDFYADAEYVNEDCEVFFPSR